MPAENRLPSSGRSLQLEIEREALKKERDRSSRERLEKIEKEVGRPEL